MIIDEVTVPFFFLRYHSSYKFFVEFLLFFSFIVLRRVLSEFFAMFFAFAELIGKLLIMGEGQYITTVIGTWDFIVDGSVLVFVVDGRELGVGLFDALGYLTHGKKYD